MAWRDHMLRLLAGGLETDDGEPLDVPVVVRVLDRIRADEELSRRLDDLDEAGVRDEFMALYQRERSGEG